MRSILDTPVVAVDLDVVDRNIERMQRRAEAQGLALRAHVKTHKLPFLAERQLAAGAAGIACQKLSEAWVFAGTGLGPILITYPLMGEPKWREAARLARIAPVSFCADSEMVIDGLSRNLDPAASVPVMVDCDTGRWRTGVPEPEDALRLAQLIERRPGMEFGGLITHPAPDQAYQWFQEATGLFAAAGLEIPAISVGGTPGSFEDKPIYEVATELRVGTYIYGDRACIVAGGHSLEQCAMRVHATVISTPSATRAVIDAGSKVLSSDAAEGVDAGEFGLIPALPEAKLSFLSEEHGHLDLRDCPGQLKLGQSIEVIPNHACAVSNLNDRIHLHRSGSEIVEMPVWARGKSR